MRTTSMAMILAGGTFLAGCANAVHEYPVSSDEAKNSGSNYQTVSDARGSIFDNFSATRNDERPAGRHVGWVIYKDEDDAATQRRSWLRRQ